MDRKGVIFASSPREVGNMSLYYGDTAYSLENRKNFLAGLGIRFQDLVCAKQVHGDTIRLVDEKDLGKGALRYDDSLDHTDALLTDKKKIPLAIFTADCLPVFLHDPKKNIIGLIHAGWRSSYKKITAKTIKLMQQAYRTQPADIKMHFGPAIRSCCYKVGKEFLGYFAESVIQKDKSCYLDLVDANKRQAIVSGVRNQNITDDEKCTFCSGEDFFSFRREGESCGRSLSVIMLL